MGMQRGGGRGAHAEVARGTGTRVGRAEVPVLGGTRWEQEVWGEFRRTGSCTQGWSDGERKQGGSRPLMPLCPLTRSPAGWLQPCLCPAEPQHCQLLRELPSSSCWLLCQVPVPARHGPVPALVPLFPSPRPSCCVGPAAPHPPQLPSLLPSLGTAQPWCPGAHWGTGHGILESQVGRELRVPLIAPPTNAQIPLPQLAPGPVQPGLEHLWGSACRGSLVPGMGWVRCSPPAAPCSSLLLSCAVFPVEQPCCSLPGAAHLLWTSPPASLRSLEHTW